MKYSVEWVKDRHAKGEIKNYLFFWGHQAKDNQIDKSCLSQWWYSEFYFEGIKYSTAEQWMMARKAALFNDHDIFNRILATTNPKEVKALGRMIKNFDQNIWDKNKYEIVKIGNRLKFSQNKPLRDYLINTSDAVIVEASPYDLIWGIGLKQEDEGIKDPSNWKGLNLLGFALMEVRDFLIDPDKV